ncbi:MAG: hypothetical protein ACWA41_05285 [Putridiphycobacter sp.]
MKTKIYVPLIILFLAFMLQSCEGETKYYRNLENNTTDQIHVYATGEWFESIDQNLASGESMLIYYWEKRGGTSANMIPAEGIDTLIITNNAGDTCNKAYEPQENWVIEVEEAKKIPSIYAHNYTFVVNQGDF